MTTQFVPSLVCNGETELGTPGREIYPELRLAFWHNPDETFSLPQGAQQRLYIVLVEQGTGILSLDGARQVFLAPVLFCLSPQDGVALEQSRDLKAQGLYFYPGIINSLFNMENIYGDPKAFSGTAFQDLHLMEPFTDRSPRYVGQLVTDAASIQRITTLFHSVKNELAQQRDWYWPCRSRSYLLEMLFTLYNLYNAPLRDEPRFAEHPLVPTSNELDSLIMYLHMHYHEKLTIRSLSRLFHTNRTTLEERFREATGSPIMAYLTLLRLRVAASMLHDTTVPVFEVAERVGFSDSTHFGRMFRKYIGCSPVEYRQRYCWVI